MSRHHDSITEAQLQNWKQEVRFNTPDTVGRLYTGEDGEGVPTDGRSAWHQRHAEQRAEASDVSMRKLRATGFGR